MSHIVSAKIKTAPEDMLVYRHYNDTVELRFDKVDHVYYLMTPEGMERQLNVTTIVKIIDKSEVLTAWASKMCAEKAIRLMPYTEADTTKIMSRSDFTTLMGTAKTAHKDRLTEAGDLGSAAHQCLEDSIKTALKFTAGVVQCLINLPMDERAANGAEAGFKWMQEHNVRWISTESKIYSRQHKFAGTMDGVCIVDSCANSMCCQTYFRDVMSLADWKTSNYLHVEYLYQTAGYVLAHEEEFPDVHIEDRWVLRLGKDDAEFDPWHLTRKDLEEDSLGFLNCLALLRSHELVVKRTAATKKFKTGARKQIRLSEKAANAEKEQLEKALEKERRINEKAADKEKAKADKAAAKESLKAAKAAFKLLPPVVHDLSPDHGVWN